jgi:hypothetical protein
MRRLDTRNMRRLDTRNKRKLEAYNASKRKGTAGRPSLQGYERNQNNSFTDI